MVDIFDEVEQDLRAERAEKLLKKYAWVLIALALAIVGAAAGWQVWQRYQNQRDAAAASSYVAVQNALEQAGAGQSEANKAGEVTALDKIADTAPEGYKTLARLREAGLKADANDVRGAIGLWNTVAADPNADRLLRDLATLLAITREIDHGDPATIESRLKALAEPGNPWSTLAQEQLAILDLRQGKTEAARKLLQVLSVDIESPAGLRARAAALLARLGPPAAK